MGRNYSHRHVAMGMIPAHLLVRPVSGFPRVGAVSPRAPVWQTVCFCFYFRLLFFCFVLFGVSGRLRGAITESRSNQNGK
jgi:hypothetical protein